MEGQCSRMVLCSLMKLVLKETSSASTIFHFELRDGDTTVGKLELYPTPIKKDSYPEGYESHFYYEIEPEYRGKGYGIEILKLGLLEAKNIGLRRVSIICTDENIAAQKTIQENGAQFQESKMLENGQQVFKYKVDFS
ncbi:MAG: family N-acetyltransferase [Parcubacteria group bacterium]|nr:family N-acetyltransferase [Parcubacteria group bacterium]